MLLVKIKLIQRLMYWWDVFFTWIDHKQLQLYVGMKAELLRLETLNSHQIVLNSRKTPLNSLKWYKIVLNGRKSHQIVETDPNLVFERAKPICGVDNKINSDTINIEDKKIIKYKIRRKCG